MKELRQGAVVWAWLKPPNHVRLGQLDDGCLTDILQLLADFLDFD